MSEYEEKKTSKRRSKLGDDIDIRSMKEDLSNSDLDAIVDEIIFNEKKIKTPKPKKSNLKAKLKVIETNKRNKLKNKETTST